MAKNLGVAFLNVLSIDPSYKTDLNLSGLFREGKTHSKV